MGCNDVACKDENFDFGKDEGSKECRCYSGDCGSRFVSEAEGLVQVDLLLPGYQTQLINQVAEVSKGPVILVVMSAGGVSISFAKSNQILKQFSGLGILVRKVVQPLQMLYLENITQVANYQLHGMKQTMWTSCQ
uniref:Uncharacterized protein n=1 Tax=Nelumbo nucifera TaxID=4432 RepID=A0A822XP08_NELNU|nr:TPA_asm: hypothetical protein HUJ06_023500 [Nelumbo nucifera]